MTRLRAGEVAAAAGVGVESLRYYERRGLLPEPERTLGGHRVYAPEAVTRLRVIRAAARLGFTLTEVAELLDGTGRRGGLRSGLRSSRTAPDLAARFETKLEEVRERIRDLHAVEAALEATLAAGCADLEVCVGVDGCPIPFPAPADAR